MSSTNIPASDGSYFENQRALLVNDVAAVRLLSAHCFHDAPADTVQSLENVLQNINKLNRSLEGVIAVRLPDAMHFYCHWSLYRHRSLAVLRPNMILSQSTQADSLLDIRSVTNSPKSKACGRSSRM